MKVSIIVPVYNVEKYLKECLESLVNQTYKNIEIICINDGSTDKSLEVLKEFENRFPEIVRVFNKLNGGLADTRNYGLSKVTGEYIGFVDSDDWIDKDMYKDMIELAIKESADVVVCDYTEVYEDKKKLIVDDNQNHKMLYESLVCNKIFKRNLFENEGIRFPLGLWYEDNATTYKLLFLANNVKKINESYYFYRRTRPNSIMNSQNNKKIYDMWKIYENLNDFFSKRDLTYDEIQQVEYIFIKNILFRQIPKIIKLEFPNLIKMKAKIRQHYELIEKSFPDWDKNKFLIEDKNNYFKNKIGNNYIKKIKNIKKGLIYIPLAAIEKKIGI